MSSFDSTLSNLTLLCSVVFRKTHARFRCNRCIVVDLCCNCEACSLDAPGVVTPDTAPHRPHPGHTGRGTLAARSRGRAAGGGTAPDTRRPSQRWKAPPRGTPFRHPHSGQRRPARAHAGGPVLGSHARIDRTRDTRVAEPWQPAPEDGRPGEGQRLTPGAPHNGGKHPPPGTPYRHPHSEQRRPARAHAVGPVMGPHARTDRTGDTRDAEPWLPAPEDGRPGAAAPTNPSQVGGNRDRTAPPPSTPDGARDRGKTRGGARTTCNGPTSAQCRDQARCARHTTRRGGGADTARARAHTHEKDTRGPPEGQPNRARGTHRPHGMAYQRTRVRDTRTGRPATRSAEHAGREG